MPILPAGTPVEDVRVDDQPVQLAATADGLAWGVRRAGTYRLKLRYRADVHTAGVGSTLALPVPQASSIVLRASVPEADIDLAVVPAAGRDIQRTASSTTVRATVPTTRGVLVSWRRASGRDHVLSRAEYRGRLEGDAVRFLATYDLELWSDAAFTLPLLPRSVTLSRLEVDGEAAPIVVDGDRFATRVSGRGRHTVTAGFEIPVQTGDGPPSLHVELPEVPVSRLELRLPGKKDIAMAPSSSVTTRTDGDETVATAHLPMTRALQISWTEAVPDAVRAELRAHAGLYHAAHAEEGVLAVRALVDIQVTRGATSAWTLTVPEDVQVNEVVSPSGGVVDWRLEPELDGGRRQLRVFLDHPLDGQLLLDVRYDRSLPAAGTSMTLPLLGAPDAQRRKGMVALLQSRELTLEPAGEPGATRIGENQLPAFVRDAVEHSVAHTFKYVDAPPDLPVVARRPERQQGRFDALVDTLISLGEVTLELEASEAAGLDVDFEARRRFERHFAEGDQGVHQGVEP
ncbi:MAG: hypothetical protein AAFY88_18650, partial [Acidobacteriota bacterium]